MTKTIDRRVASEARAVLWVCGRGVGESAVDPGAFLPKVDLEVVVGLRGVVGPIAGYNSAEISITLRRFLSANVSVNPTQLEGGMNMRAVSAAIGGSGGREVGGGNWEAGRRKLP